MSRKCSHCGLNGHNSRTCLLGTAMASRTFDGGGTIVTTNTTDTTDIHTCRRAGIRLFGVDMVAADAEVAAPEPFDCMRKSWSMGNLAHYGNQEETPPPSMVHSLLADPVDGYTSDDLVHATSNSRGRRKGVPWSEEEHRLFLVGLERLGKGDWRGISRNFVKTRTPTQVASHAQKYFLRRGNIHKRRRRSSLFDITPDTAASTSLQAQESSHKGVGRIEALPSIDEMSTSNFVDSDKMETEEVPGGEAFNMGEGRGKVFPIYCDEGGGDGPLAERSSVEYRPAGLDLPSQVGGGGNRYDTVALLVPMWPPLQPLDPVPVPVSMPVVSNSKVVKPIPLIRIGGVPLPPSSPSPPPKVMDNEVVKLSVLSLNSTHPVMPPSALSRKLHEEEELGKRHSAFQAITSAVPDANSDLDTTGNTCNAAISVS